MLELADILRRHGPAYEQQFGTQLLPSHRRALAAILACRTPALGGHLYGCEPCGQTHFAYHSCHHRACPQCGHADATAWIERQKIKLLPVPYFLVTFTVPEGLRALIRSHPKELYGLLFTHSAATLQEGAAQPKHLGAQLGLLGVLHTWSRQLIFHPHVHYVVPAGGLRADGLRWVRLKNPDFFLPQKVLARRFRNRLREALESQPELFAPVPASVWRQEWVVDVQPVGSGQGALKYLSAYVYRTALSSQRIMADDERGLTFRFRRSDTGNWETLTVAPQEFIRRFLQHVLPAGFQRLRYFGWLSAAAKAKWERILAWLDWKAPALTPPTPRPPPRCPHCQKPMRLLGQLPRAPP